MKEGGREGSRGRMGAKGVVGLREGWCNTNQPTLSIYGEQRIWDLEGDGKHVDACIHECVLLYVRGMYFVWALREN